jgi:hypothetical protein
VAARNIDIVLGGLADAIRSRDPERIAEFLGPDLVWEGPGLLTWSEIWCDVENLKSFRSSRDRRVSPGHRVKDVSALHNYLALIFHCHWRQSRERTWQVARSETFRAADDPRYVRSPEAWSLACAAMDGSRR